MISSNSTFDDVIKELTQVSIDRFNMLRAEGTEPEVALADVLAICMKQHQVALAEGGYNNILLETFRMLGEDIREFIKQKENKEALRIMELHFKVAGALAVAAIINVIRADSRFGIQIPDDYDKQIESLKAVKRFCEDSFEAIRSSAYNTKGKRGS